jgi:hypothetical protein
LGEISVSADKDPKKIDIAAYRGVRVAFVGAGAAPGASNDLVIGGQCYLRVVNKEGKDLRPRSLWWEVLVQGVVMQVIPENRIVVIDVSEKDWIVLETG